MNVAKVAIEGNRITYMVMCIIILTGISTYFSLSRDAMPPYTVRVCKVVTNFPGASPERVEELITDKIEKSAQELPELKTVTSESRTGLSIVTVEVKPDIQKADLQAIWDKLRRKIDEIRPDLPDNIYGPNVKDDGLGVVYGIMIGMEGDGFSNHELKLYSDDIRDELIKLPDASRVDVGGIQDQEIFVEFDNARLAQLGLTPAKLKDIISKTNIVFSGGQVSMIDELIVLEPTGNFEDVDDLKKILVPTGLGGDPIQLGDFTKIYRSYEDPITSMVKVSGVTGLSISVSLREGANLVKLGKEVDEKIAMYNSTLPHGIKLSRAASQDVYVDAKVKNFMGNVFQSIYIVLGVMLMFLGFRTGMFLAALIPVHMILTVWVMGLAGISLNQVSLAALIMASGVLVDNAIVVSDSIIAKLKEGQTPLKAAIDAAGELFIPLLTSALTTAAAFLPFYLAKDPMGEIMGDLFSVMTIALLGAWVLSMTIVPMLGMYFIKLKVQTPEQAAKQKKSIFDKMMGPYDKLLMWTMRNPVKLILIIIAMFFASLTLFPKLPFIFFPDSDRNLVTVDVNLPLGAKIEKTEEVVSQIEDFIKKEVQVKDGRPNGIVDWTSFIGEGPASYDLGYQQGEANSSYAHMLLNTDNFASNNGVIAKMDSFCFATFPDATVDVGPLAGGASSGADVEIRLKGDDPEQLYRISERIKQKMSATPGTQNISDDWGPRIKKFIIDIDQDKANRAGVTNQDIALSLMTALNGFTAGDFRDGDDNIDIVMRSEDGKKLDVESLRGMNIFAQGTGRNVPLMQVADLVPDWQYAKILRRDLYRTLTVSCDAKDGFTASDITKILSPFIAEDVKNWPKGNTYESGGESESSKQSIGAVGDQLPIAGLIILLLMVGQFNSIRKTFLILSTIPLGLIGVLFGLFVFQSYFGFMAFLGVISLAGIVINNAIVLIDCVDSEKKENNKNDYDAIISAARQRFQPIMLSTLTSAAGLIPMYTGGGEMWQPMAVAIMIGQICATAITLLFVPALYKLLYRAKNNAA